MTKAVQDYADKLSQERQAPVVGLQHQLARQKKQEREMDIDR
jgi:hypothetical protein